MKKKRPIAGESTKRRVPHWKPLLNLLAADFMWMFEVELEDGRRLQAYKHYHTRRYLHLDDEDHAFVYTWGDGRYEEVDPWWLLDLVLRADPETRWRPPGLWPPLPFVGDAVSRADDESPFEDDELTYEDDEPSFGGAEN